MGVTHCGDWLPWAGVDGNLVNTVAGALAFLDELGDPRGG